MATISEFQVILAVEDLNISRDFYLTKLGFTEALRTGGWSFLRRDGLKVRIGHCPGIAPMRHCPQHSLIVQAMVDDAHSLYEEFARNGVEVTQPEDKPWGFREFGIVTVDGHRFMFSQKL